MKNRLKPGVAGSRTKPELSPSHEQVQARNRLQARGIPFEEERLFKYAAAGDAETVKLLLTAGINSKAKDADGTEALVIAARNGRKEVVSLLLAEGAQTATLVEALENSKKGKKDRWDKFASLSPVFTFTSTLLVALVGGAFTYLHNKRQTELVELQQQRDAALKQEQNRVIELQTVEKMIPHLAAGEQKKRAALIAISTLASHELAAKMGQAFGGEGSVQALESIATSSDKAVPAAVSALTALASNEQTSDGAQNALGSVFRSKKDSVVSILLDGEPSCAGFIADADKGLVLTAEYCLDLKRGKTFDIQTWKGHKVKATPQLLPNNLGVGVLRISEHLPALAIASKPPTLGERLIALGELPARAGKLVGVVGVIQGINVAEDDFPNSHHSAGKFLSLEFTERASGMGTGGGPILDSNGDVACMIHHGTEKSELCLSAQSLVQALKEL